MDSVTERPAGGFGFENVNRNELLTQKTGMKMPLATSTGTTICGIIFKVYLCGSYASGALFFWSACTKGPSAVETWAGTMPQRCGGCTLTA